MAAAQDRSAAKKPAPTTAADAAAGPRPYRAPTGVERTLTVGRARGGSGPGRVVARADWLVLREHGVPSAEVFHVSYVAERGGSARPIVFLFNGGPGAASAFLHIGTAGPRRIAFDGKGRALPPPVRLVDNAESWLGFADLVFVDPVGTGFSRTVSESRLEQQGVDVDDEKREKRTKELPETRNRYFRIKRDIDVLAEFVASYLSAHRRWDSPVAIAGESYGGFRVGKLMRALPERGVGLGAAALISPAMDFLGLVGSDYDILSWVNVVPTMALTARHHGRIRGRFASMRPDALRTAAEGFADGDLARMLLLGERLEPGRRDETLATLADLTGLPPELVRRCGGRIPIELFGRELLRDEGLVCGLYDGAVTGPNVFPDREGQPNPDPTLAGITTAFTAGINTMLRGELGLATEREYMLVNEDVWKHWADDRSDGYWQRQLECADDMRYGMAVNPSLRVLVAHGWYDLVTTYFSSRMTVAALRLPPELRARIELRNFDGGHMFYTWDASRRAIAGEMATLIGRRA